MGVWVGIPDWNDLKLGTVAVLDTVSQPTDFGFKRSVRIIGG